MDAVRHDCFHIKPDCFLVRRSYLSKVMINVFINMSFEKVLTKKVVHKQAYN